jgi:hypothetical protein
MDERQSAYSDRVPANDERDYLESPPEVFEPPSYGRAIF